MSFLAFHALVDNGNKGDSDKRKTNHHRKRSWKKLVKRSPMIHRLTFGSSPTSDDTTQKPALFKVTLVDGQILHVDLNRLREKIKYRDVLIQDLVKEVCQMMHFLPTSVGFFGLRCKASNKTWSWVVQTRDVASVDQKKQKFYFRLQFKVLLAEELRRRDENAHSYYVKQSRHDFKTGVFSKELARKGKEKDLLLVVILEILLTSKDMDKENSLATPKNILKNKSRKEFNLNNILKKHQNNDNCLDFMKCRKTMEKSLSNFLNVNPEKDFMTEIEGLENFNEEIFHVTKYERGTAKPKPVELWLSPNQIQKRVVSQNIRKAEWNVAYDQMVRLEKCENDAKREVKFKLHRTDQAPEEMCCVNEEMFESICSLADGYFRLNHDQYQSILNDQSTFLLEETTFGPIQRVVAENILQRDGMNPGKYLIREQGTSFEKYVLSFIADDQKFQHMKIFQHREKNRTFYSPIGSKLEFDTLESLCKHYADAENSDDKRIRLETRILPKHTGNVPLYSKYVAPVPTAHHRHPVVLTEKEDERETAGLDTDYVDEVELMCEERINSENDNLNDNENQHKAMNNGYNGSVIRNGICTMESNSKLTSRPASDLCHLDLKEMTFWTSDSCSCLCHHRIENYGSLESENTTDENTKVISTEADVQETDKKAVKARSEELIIKNTSSLHGQPAFSTNRHSTLSRPSEEDNLALPLKDFNQVLSLADVSFPISAPTEPQPTFCSKSMTASLLSMAISQNGNLDYVSHSVFSQKAATSIRPIPTPALLHNSVSQIKTVSNQQHRDLSHSTDTSIATSIIANLLLQPSASFSPSLSSSLSCMTDSQSFSLNFSPQSTLTAHTNSLLAPLSTTYPCHINPTSLNQQPLNQQPLNQQPLNQQPLNQQPLNQQPLNQQPLNQQPLGQQQSCETIGIPLSLFDTFCRPTLIPQHNHLNDNTNKDEVENVGRLAKALSETDKQDHILVPLSSADTNVSYKNSLLESEQNQQHQYYRTAVEIESTAVKSSVCINASPQRRSTLNTVEALEATSMEAPSSAVAAVTAEVEAVSVSTELASPATLSALVTSSVASTPGVIPATFAHEAPALSSIIEKDIIVSKNPMPRILQAIDRKGKDEERLFPPENHSLLPVNSSPYVKESPYKMSMSPKVQTQNNLLIHKEAIQRARRLGSGAFGEVFQGTWMCRHQGKTYPINVAVKSIIRHGRDDNSAYNTAIEEIQSEAKLLATLNNDNSPGSNHIIKLYGMCIDGDTHQIVEEFAEYGQLDKYINLTKNHVTAGDIANFCKQIAVGMDYMHEKNILHRDLACRNILVISHTHVKITDFGMSRQVGIEKDYYRMREGTKVPIKWMALESIDRRRFTKETDCWSFGVAAWEMFTIHNEEHEGHHAKPYAEIKDHYSQVYNHLRNGNRLLQPSTCPGQLWGSVERCWKEDPQERPTFRQLKDVFMKYMVDVAYHT